MKQLILDQASFIERTANARCRSTYRSDGGSLLHEIDFEDRTYTSVIERAVETDDLKGDWWMSFLRGAEIATRSHHGKEGTLRVVDLFCGAGGLSLGFRTAAKELGFRIEVMAAADQDRAATRVFAANHLPLHVRASSMTSLVDFRIKGSRSVARFVYEPELLDIPLRELSGHVDVVLAGPPCQGYSSLNNRTRRRDPRNDLYLTVPAIAVALAARAVVVENVPEVTRDHKGVVETTVTLLKAAGYEVTAATLNAASLGWPQRRRRFFLVARRDQPPHPLRELAEDLEDVPRSVLWAIGDLQDSGPDDFMSRRPEMAPETRRRIDWLFDNDEYDLPLSQRPDCHRGGTTYGAVYGRMFPDQPAPTITTGFMTMGRGRFVHPTRRRVLTPREAARLQGFPDTYRFVTDGAELPTTAKLSKWIGDAVPMPLGYVAAMSALLPGLSQP